MSLNKEEILPLRLTRFKISKNIFRPSIKSGGFFITFVIMQTFLPYPDFRQSLESLDNKRLGKQRVEAYQIISAITQRPRKDGKPYKGWVSHPCSVMWRDYVNALKLYYNDCIDVWKERGFKNTMEYETIEGDFVLPHWLGDEQFHSSHRANLLRKEMGYYSQHGWNEDPNDPYIWMDGDGQWYKQMVGEKKREYFFDKSY
jgi:hypothetical protein